MEDSREEGMAYDMGEMREEKREDGRGRRKKIYCCMFLAIMIWDWSLWSRETNR